MSKQKPEQQSNPVGRPTKYLREFSTQTEKLCKLGATDKELADFFSVDESTINNWKLGFPEFLESIKSGKTLADANVADSLYKRALGYEHAEDVIFNDKGVPLVVPTIKHYPPDSTAMIFWLKNRRAKDWRDKQDIDQHNTGETLIRVIYEDDKAETPPSGTTGDPSGSQAV